MTDSRNMLMLIKDMGVIIYVVVSLTTILYLAIDSYKGGRDFQLDCSKNSVHGSIRRTNPVSHHRQSFPVPGNTTIYEMMQSVGALRSMDHLRKFEHRRDLVPALFDKKLRYKPALRTYAAIKLSDSYAYLHIWKNGGTTVEELTGEHQLPLHNNDIMSRQWVTLVRDPIDRFLSAWAECGVRLYEQMINFDGEEIYSSLQWIEEEYDFRIRAFVQEVENYLPPTKSCHTHAFPQANFMMNRANNINPNVVIVGDLSEMRQNLEIAGLRLGSNTLKVRDANEDLVKSFYFQSHREKLSNTTLLELCEFLAMDYFLFDFDPPAICIEESGPLSNFTRRTPA